MIGNYDSFTSNLVQYLRMLCAEVLVDRDAALAAAEALALRPTHLVAAPGPGTPREGGRSSELSKAFAGNTPVLGVCLGPQAIAAAGGGHVRSAMTPMHGKTSRAFHDGR